MFTATTADKAPAEPVSRPKEALTGGQVGGASSSGYINGASVGMAVNNAVEVLKHQGPINMATFAKDIHAIASDILRVSQSLEKGNLLDRTEKTVGATKSVVQNSGDNPDLEEDGIPF